ncbi:uncharacterized protein LOC103716477 [Phoenix dactylifera]|uniref:Uncharacterized protein LOC103716477 n=1 Tax=Phoenix dactylifera TaxID=42345 RepID=A0A8B9AJ05_PHODC|nr:uncharacterized protein LOC103716477 [Phoenix dactylifera]
MGRRKLKWWKQLHERVKQHIEKKNEQYASKASKGRKQVVFEPDDWVWVHMRKERFPAQRKCKLNPRGDGPFQVLEKINDNAYKIDLSGEYNISATFNIADLYPFDIGHDSRMNPFEERGNDATHQEEQTESSISSDPLHISSGPITRSKVKRLREALIVLVLNIWARQASSGSTNIKLGLSNSQAVINVIQIEDGSC